MNINFFPFGSSLFWPVVLMVILSANLVCVLLCNPRLSYRRKFILGLLKAAVIVLVGCILLRPTIISTEIKRDASTLVVMLDSSRSMAIEDVPAADSATAPATGTATGATVDSATGTATGSITPGSKISRFAAQSQTIQQTEPAFRAAAEAMELKFFRFDSQLIPMTVQTDNKQSKMVDIPDIPTGHQTAIGYSMDEMLRQEAGKRLLGLILLSDGAQRTSTAQSSQAQTAALPQSSAAQLQRMAVPMYTLCFGSPDGKTDARDIAIVDMLAPSRVFLKNLLTVEGQFRVDGFTGVDIPVRLRFETSPGKLETVAETTIKAGTSGEIIPVQLSYEPKEVGEFKLSLEVPAIPGDATLENNSMDAFVRVIDGGLKVFYLEGAIRPEQKFIVRAFDDSPNVQLDVMRLDRRTAIDQAEVAARFDNPDYKAFILGDVHSTFLSVENWQKLVERVQNGAGLFLTGGFNSYGPGGFAQSPLEVIVPIVMDRFERQNPDELPSKDMHVDRSFRLKPTALGQQFPPMQLDGDRNIWSELPELDGANRWGSVKPGADVVAGSDEKNSVPLLVSAQVGRGRVMAFAADSTWRWHMAGFAEAHNRFWLQSIFWLAQKEETFDGSVSFTTDARRVDPGTTVNFFAEVRVSDEVPVKESDFDLKVTAPNGQVYTLPISKEEDRFIASFSETDLPGDYQYNLQAFRDGEQLGQTKGRFQVVVRDIELDNPVAEPGLLSQMAVKTGGKPVTAKDLPGLLEQFVEKAQSLEIRQEKLKSLWDRPWILLTIIGLWSMEWFLRKKWGQV